MIVSFFMTRIAPEGLALFIQFLRRSFFDGITKSWFSVYLHAWCMIWLHSSQEFQGFSPSKGNASLLAPCREVQQRLTFFSLCHRVASLSFLQSISIVALVCTWCHWSHHLLTIPNFVSIFVHSNTNSLYPVVQPPNKTNCEKISTEAYLC